LALDWVNPATNKNDGTLQSLATTSNGVPLDPAAIVVTRGQPACFLNSEGEFPEMISLIL